MSGWDDERRQRYAAAAADLYDAVHRLSRAHAALAEAQAALDEIIHPKVD